MTRHFSEAGQRHIVIVDPVAHFFNYIPAARDLGYGAIVLSSNPDVCRAEEAGHRRMDDAYAANSALTAFVPYTADDLDSALSALAPWRGAIAGVIAGDEVTVPAAAALGRRLGFDYAPAEDAACQQIKSRMKQRLVARGVPTPRFVVVETREDAIAAWRDFGGDCMMKMVDYAMSYGISRVRSPDELSEAWDRIAARRAALDHDFATQSSVVMEEFVSGREFSVEGYEQDGRIEVLNFCEKLSHENFMVIGHYVPARTSAGEAEALRRIAADCVRALGIRNSVFHAEVHMRGDQPFLIECAARPPGQYSVGVMKRVYGFELMRIALQLACGEKVTVRACPPRKWSAIMALYSDETGIVRSTRSLDELRARPECYALKCSVKAGDAVLRLETFRDVLGLALLEAPDPQAIREVYDWARASVCFPV